MIKPLYDRSPEQKALIESRKKKIADFFSRFPTPFLAWVERQPKREVRWLYETLTTEKDLTPEKVLCLFEGKEFKIPSYRKLRDFWFRAALELVDGDTLTIAHLGIAFSVPKSRRYGLNDKEEEWKARKRPEDKKGGPRYRKARQDFWTTERDGIINALNFLLQRNV